MEDATGAPSSFTVCKPRRPRASGRDGDGVGCFLVIQGGGT
jgi:hypothetical protein